MPAPSPELRFQRLLRLAQFDALSLLVVATPATLAAAIGRDWPVAVIGAGVVGCGALEWSGQRQLQRGALAGLNWLCAAQLGCLALLLLYAWRLAHQAAAAHLLALLPAFARAQLDELLLYPEAVDDLLLLAQRLTAGAIALTATLYQGGLALFYQRSRPAVRTALATPPPLSPPHS